MKVTKQKVYISSVISGYEDTAQERFDAAKKFVEKGYYIVSNPFKAGEKAAWLECLIRDCKQIKYRVTSVYFFGKWYRSAGCWMELLVAIRHGKTCWFEDKWTGIPFAALKSFLEWLWKIDKLTNK